MYKGHKDPGRVSLTPCPLCSSDLPAALMLHTGEYLRHLVHDKEEREYMAWLDNVRKFVTGK